MKNVPQIALLFVALLILIFQLFGSAIHPVEGARGYQYKVITVTGMSQLRTQSDAQEGRVTAIEKIIQDQSAQGWQLFQADGYLLYFRR